MKLNDNDAVIVSSARTPIGRAFKGKLRAVRPEDLAQVAIEEAIARVKTDEVIRFDDLIVGCAEPRGEQGHNIARRIAVLLGQENLPGVTTNRFCASSLQALANAFQAIRAGEGHAFIVAGVESVSRIPQDGSDPHPSFAQSSDLAHRQLQGEAWTDPKSQKLLADYYVPMGATAEFVARKMNVSRLDQDEFAAESQRRASEAHLTGYFEAEIAPVTTPGGEVVSEDESIRSGTTVEKLGTLKSAFTEKGSVTAGNSCPLNDGASALIVMSAKRAQELGLEPLARVLSSQVTALSPEIMGLGPIESTTQLLARNNWAIGDFDVIELNEAFAAQAVPVIRELRLNPDRVNPHGGAIALGHPFGATGARLVQTLIHGLQERDGTRGLATLCIGGGQGMTLAIERTA